MFRHRSAILRESTTGLPQDGNKGFFISVINQLDAQNYCFTISLCHATICFEHMCSSSGGQNCITQPLEFWPPDDENMCSKHVEAWNKLIVKQKFCTSSWLITEINILRCTISKTSKKVSLSIIFLHSWIKQSQTALIPKCASSDAAILK